MHISCAGALSGSAQVTHVRGKARFFYEYKFELSFEISNKSLALNFKGIVNTHIYICTYIRV
jgi:hypothetical protein